jgi:hypothetical protein
MVPRWDRLSKEERSTVLKACGQDARFTDKSWKELPFWIRKQIIPSMNKFETNRSKSDLSE